VKHVRCVTVARAQEDVEDLIALIEQIISLVERIVALFGGGGAGLNKDWQP